MNKKEWALCIGHLIIAMNEIEGMIDINKEKLTRTKTTKSWLKKPLKNKLEDIKDSIDENNRIQTEIKKQIIETIGMCEIRNLFAHGKFALDCRSQKPANNKWVIFTHNHQPLSESDIKNAAQKCCEISDRISELLAVLQFSKM
jgi:hypothetical protein